MANCPHCNRRLRITDWKPNCPGCGVNLMFYGFEERFYEDAKRSELSMASMRVGSKRTKAGLAGSFWAKARLIVMTLPLVSLLLPWGSLRASMPFGAQQWQAGLLGFMNLFMGSAAESPYLLSVWGKDFAGKGEVKDLMAQGLPFLQSMWNSEWSYLFQRGVVLFALTALAALLALLVLILSMFSFASLKRMSTIAGVLGVLGALTCAGGFAAGIVLQNASNTLASPLFAGALGYGALLGLAMFVCTAVANLSLAKKGVQVEYAEGDVERREIWQKIKKGQIELADLPYPVVETAETREREAMIEKELGGAEA